MPVNDPIRAEDIIAQFFTGRCVIITGAAGTIGRELLAQLLSLGAGEIRAIDNDENGLFELTEIYGHDPRVRIRYGDVTSPDGLRHVFHGADYLFHSAALKHVAVCESTPAACVRVNVAGVENVVEAALAHHVARVIFTSSDKAVHPTNVMGASKLLGERLAIASNDRNHRTLISCTRFGNVAGSRGSVLPIFREQIRSGGNLTLTSRQMTRFFMTRQLAVRLVIESMVHMSGGEIFIPRMRAIAIADLAQVMIRLLAPLAGRAPEDVKIEIVGARAGEKCYEELLSDEERAHSISAGDYLVVLPLQRAGAYDGLAHKMLGPTKRTTQHYNSDLEIKLTPVEIEAFLRENNLLPELSGAPMLRLVAAA